MPEPGKVTTKANFQARRAARRDREKVKTEAREGDRIDLKHARTEAAKITNAARQKLMLEVIDDLERCRSRSKATRERLKRVKSREEFVSANQAIVVTDDEGRAWVVRAELPDGTTFVDNSGVLWKYIASEKHLSRINDL